MTEAWKDAMAVGLPGGSTDSWLQWDHRGGGGEGIMMGSNLPGRKEGASVLEVHCTFKAQFWELHWAWGK